MSELFPYEPDISYELIGYVDGEVVAKKTSFDIETVVSMAEVIRLKTEKGAERAERSMHRYAESLAEDYDDRNEIQSERLMGK